MSLLTRGSRAAARPLRQNLSRPCRRFASDHPEPHYNKDHAAHESAFHVDSGAKGNEGFGAGFYVCLTLIPVSMVLYSLTTTSDNFIQRLGKTWREHEIEEERKNIIHTHFLEKAAEDRMIFKSIDESSNLPSHRFIEMFNSSSPWNVAPGDTANLEKLEQHYRQEDARREQARLARMKDGKVVTVYD